MFYIKYGKGPVASKIKLIIILALVWLLLLLLMHYPAIIEQYYSKGLYLLVCRVLQMLFNIFPFSVGDVLYILLIIYGLYALVNLIRLLLLKRFKNALIYTLKLVAAVQALVLGFYLLWGMNYFREPAARRLNLQDTSYTFEDVKSVAAMLIDSANVSRSRLSNSDLIQGNAVIYQSASDAVGAIRSVNFPAYHPRIKPSLLTFFLNYMGTEGYFNPFTGEAQMDYQMPVFLKPFTACHEMGHQMGFGAEDEADFVGFVAGTSTHNRLQLYSAYYEGASEFLYTVARRDTVSFKTLKLLLSPQLRADFKTERLYWKSFEGKAGIFSSLLYDQYLKTNNQPQGLNTYNQMTRLVMAWYIKKGFITTKH